MNSKRQEQLMGWLMASPAILLLLAFLIIPFFMAFGFSFTNQRLISPNPTEFVGLRNFNRLLTVRTLTVEPIVDEDTGELILDEDGNRTYPRLRNFTRNNPDYPELDGLQEWFRWERSDDHIGGRWWPSRTIKFEKCPILLNRWANRGHYQHADSN